MKYLRVKNWAEFQHYRDRLPPWIKLHRALLTDYAFIQLPDEVKGQLMMIWVLASQTDGKIPDDPKWVGARIGATKPVRLDSLVASGWLLVEQDASGALARRKQTAIVETEAYKATEAETETERARARPELPPWVPAPAWKDWCDYRRSRKGFTYRAETLCLRELTKLYEAGHDPTLVIEQSIARGWSGLFPPKVEARGTPRDERAANIAALTGRAHERAIDGTAERMGGATVLALSDGVRESPVDDVGGRSGPATARGVG